MERFAMFAPKVVLLFSLAYLSVIAPQPLWAGEVLKNVLDRGYVKCAVGNRPVADTRIGETGYEGFFPEFCRVLSLALFNDRNAVELSPVSIRYGLQSVQEGDVDAYISNVTWTFSRDLVRKLTAAAVLYYDGQGFMSHKGTVRGRLADFQKASVCVSRSTTTIANLEDYVRYHNLSWTILPFASSEGRNAAFFSRKCQLLTADRLVLASTRATSTDDAENYVLHDEIISKEPLVAYINTSDMDWANVVRWSVFSTIAAEEKGITRANYKRHLTSRDPAVRRLLGVEPLKGIKAVGLKKGWARNIIASVGNYGEIFNRYLGKDSNIKVKRGLNRLWRDGGLQYSPPFR
jgi:general L-amino acid transport system substrate-binding protein